MWGLWETETTQVRGRRGRGVISRSGAPSVGIPRRGAYAPTHRTALRRDHSTSTPRGRNHNTQRQVGRGVMGKASVACDLVIWRAVGQCFAHGPGAHTRRTALRQDHSANDSVGIPRSQPPHTWGTRSHPANASGTGFDASTEGVCGEGVISCCGARPVGISRRGASPGP
jgi:hypothetical protein